MLRYAGIEGTSQCNIETLIYCYAWITTHNLKWKNCAVLLNFRPLHQ